MACKRSTLIGWPQSSPLPEESILTAMSATMGLLPAAISGGIGARVHRPLALSVVGGLLIGPMLLLVVMQALRMMVLGNEPDQQIAEVWCTPVPRS